MTVPSFGSLIAATTRTAVHHPRRRAITCLRRGIATAEEAR
jgi:hypothetical protein